MYTYIMYDNSIYNLRLGLCTYQAKLGGKKIFIEHHLLTPFFSSLFCLYVVNTETITL